MSTTALRAAKSVYPHSDTVIKSAIPFVRTLTARASGPGGLFLSAEPIVNPSAQEQKAARSRLRHARGALEERAIPKELQDKEEPQRFETESEWRDFVEMQILESMRTGQFDNLKNKGRPLPPHQPASALEYAMRIMRQNGIRPHWLQLMHDIDDDKRMVRAQLQFAWHAYMPHLPRRWETAVRVAELKIEQVNRAVDTFNLVRPMCVGHLFRLRLRINEELKRAQQSQPPPTLCKNDSQHNQSNLTDQTKLEQKRKEPAEEPRPSWQLFARFLRATEVREYDVPTWGRRRAPPKDNSNTQNGKSSTT